MEVLDLNPRVAFLNPRVSILNLKLKTLFWIASAFRLAMTERAAVNS
jgi:hypothetical protein